MLHAEDIFLLSLHLLLGSLVIIVPLIGYGWLATKDKTIGIYQLYILSVLMMALGKFIIVQYAGPGENIMENTWLDELFTAVSGGAYIFFFGHVFGFQYKKILPRFTWLSALFFMVAQIIYLLYAGFTNKKNYFDSDLWFFGIGVITLSSFCVLLIAIFQKNKTVFQKIILAGSMVFFVLISLSNLQEYFYKTEASEGFNSLFVAILFENIFFMLASARRIKDIYRESAELKFKNYSYQQKIDKLTHEKETELLKLSKDLSDWQLAALKAQMNPHFIFNAMNSIQQFILNNDTDNANLYISRFSTLLRKMLHSSQPGFISLEEEAEQLKLYLDIEKLRLGTEFSFSVDVGKDIEADALRIPGMLLQPFVENAVKHGLSLRDGPKQLEIFFSLSDEKRLQASITDNGIGRKKAQELKEQNEKLLPHQSKGIQLVEERLKLLDPSGNQGQAIHFTDLYDDAGDPCGTRVVILFPTSHTG